MLKKDDTDVDKVIGIWISEKKSQKLDWNGLAETCNLHGYRLMKLDIERPLEEQGHFNVFLHKLTDVIAAADQGDPKPSIIISRLEQYLSNHPDVVVIDPLDNVRILLNRHCYYQILQKESSFKKLGIFTPTFAEFTTNNIELNIQIMRDHRVTFPVICKPTIAHGSSAHEMIVIFNERGLSACKPPCVVQSFVNHNAVLHKVFIIGNRYHICTRPSLKNFYASGDLEPIFYTTGEVCKADSQSTLSILDPHEQGDFNMNINEDKIRHIIKVLKKKIGLTLAGFDIVLDNVTGNHAIIDINVYPSYETFPNFFQHLLETIDHVVSKRNREQTNGECNRLDEGFYDSLSLNDLLNVGTTNGFSDDFKLSAIELLK